MFRTFLDFSFFIKFLIFFFIKKNNPNNFHANPGNFFYTPSLSLPPPPPHQYPLRFSSSILKKNSKQELTRMTKGRCLVCSQSVWRPKGSVANLVE